MGHRAFGQLAIAALITAGSVLGAGCTRSEDAYGQVIVLLDSDVSVRGAALPNGELDRVQVEVSRNSQVLLNQDWVFPTTSLTLPQTVALVNQGESLSEPLRFVLTGSREGKVAFMQERELRVPAQGTATTVMRFEWLCRGVASTVNGRPNSGCPDGQTCRAGTCRAVAALPGDVATVPESKTCFDQQGCFATSQDITAQLDSSCSFLLSPSDTAMIGQINIALEPVVGQGGLCEASATARCLVGVPKGEGHGWTESVGLVRLPPHVCNLLIRGDTIARVWLSRSCPSRLPSQPVCSPWLTPAAAALEVNAGK